jgi:hypothetical protein
LRGEKLPLGGEVGRGQRMKAALGEGVRRGERKEGKKAAPGAGFSG